MRAGVAFDGMGFQMVPSYLTIASLTGPNLGYGGRMNE